MTKLKLDPRAIDRITVEFWSHADSVLVRIIRGNGKRHYRIDTEERARRLDRVLEHHASLTHVVFKTDYLIAGYDIQYYEGYFN